MNATFTATVRYDMHSGNRHAGETVSFRRLQRAERVVMHDFGRALDSNFQIYCMASIVAVVK